MELKRNIFLGIFFPCFFLACLFYFRSFEESQSKTTTTTKTITTTTTTKKSKTSVSPPPVKKPSPTPQGTFVRIWPGSHEDAGVLILSDSDDNCESDEE